MQKPGRSEIEQIYTLESGRVLASLIQILGDLDVAEEALQEAFYVALEKWPKDEKGSKVGKSLVGSFRWKEVGYSDDPTSPHRISGRGLSCNEPWASPTAGLSRPHRL